MAFRSGKSTDVASAQHTEHLDVRSRLAADEIGAGVADDLQYLLGKLPRYATRHDWYVALAYAIRDRLLARCLSTVQTISETDAGARLVAYLSAEFLTGPHPGNALLNLGIRGATEDAMASLGQDLTSLLEQEEEPGLGNGGLGRLGPAGPSSTVAQ